MKKTLLSLALISFLASCEKEALPAEQVNKQDTLLKEIKLCDSLSKLKPVLVEIQSTEGVAIEFSFEIKKCDGTEVIKKHYTNFKSPGTYLRHYKSEVPRGSTVKIEMFSGDMVVYLHIDGMAIDQWGRRDKGAMALPKGTGAFTYKIP